MEFVSVARKSHQLERERERGENFPFSFSAIRFFTMGPNEEARFSFVRGPKLEKGNSCGVLHLLPFYSKFMGKCAVDLNSRFCTPKRVSCFWPSFFGEMFRSKFFNLIPSLSCDDRSVGNSH